MDSSVVSARLIGAIFVEKGLITADQLEIALEQQRTTGERLGEILVEKFGVERLDLASALAEQWAEYERQGQAEAREALAEAGEVLPEPGEESALPTTPVASVKRPIGEIFVERGLVTDAQLEEALEEQKTSGTRLGEILVASGRLSRLELASALADQWATFQKLRPPAEPPPGEVEEAPANGSGDVLPTPEVVVPAGVPAAALASASAELSGRVEALAARLDQVAAEKTDWKPQVEKTAELLRARIEHLEEQILSRSTDEAAPDDLRGELASLASRLDAIPAPSDEWRHELAQVADNLRIRIERIEQLPVADQLSELRATLDGLTLRIDSLPAPTEEWREQIAALQASLAENPAPADENAGGGDWHDAVEALRRQIENAGQWHESSFGELRGTVDALRERIDALAVPPAGEPDELRGSLDALRAQVDGLQTDAWRPELAEVAENLRTRLERLENEETQHRASPAGGQELEDLRGSIAELGARIDSLPVPADDWREPLEGLAARVEALPTDAWRPELAEVAENLRTRLERLEQLEHQDAASEEWREPLEGLAARVEALPTDAWRPELAEVAENLRSRLERVEHGLRGTAAAESIDEIRAALDVLAERVETAPPPADEWLEPVAALQARIDSFATDGRSDELAAAAEALRSRVERLEEGMVGQARAAAVTEIAAQVAELGQKVAGTEALAAHVQSVADRIDAMPAPSDELRDQLAELAGRVDRIRTDDWRHELAEVAENLRSRLERVEQHVTNADRQETDEIRRQLAELEQSMRAHIEHVEKRLSNAVHDEALGVVVSRVEELSTRLDDTSALDDVLHRIAAVAAVAGRVDEVEQRLARETSAASGVAPALEVMREQAEQDRTRLDRLTVLVAELADRRDAAVVEHELAARANALEHAVGELGEHVATLPARIDEGIATAEAHAAGQAREALGQVESLRRQVDDLRAIVSGAGEATAHAVAELRAGIDGHAARVDSLESTQREFERLTEERASGRSADLSALRARLETVETTLSGSSGWEQAVGAANERVERLETLMVETSASEAVERSTEIEGLRLAMSERMAALESTQLKRKDLRELRDGLAQVEARIDERSVQEDASTRAVEDAVREGLAGLGEQLVAAESTYLAAGQALGRSIQGLGRAIAGADAYVSDGGLAATSVLEDEASYVAFAPTSEGYRLVACDGRTPELGGRVEIPEYEGTLVVTRVGASPLPFDARRCVYLEHA